MKTRMIKPNVLVTGGAGYIGSHAVFALTDADWTVSVIDDLSTGNRKVVPDDVAFFEGDIADRPFVERVLREQQIGAIMGGQLEPGPKVPDSPRAVRDGDGIAVRASVRPRRAAGAAFDRL